MLEILAVVMQVVLALTTIAMFALMIAEIASKITERKFVKSLKQPRVNLD